MPLDINNENPHRTQPATEPESMTPLDAETQSEETPSGIESLQDPALIQAVKEFMDTLKISPDGGGMQISLNADGMASVIFDMEEHIVSPDADSTYRLAIARVTQDLEEDPSVFNSSFISQYINTTRLANKLRQGVVEMAREEAEDKLSEEEFADGAGVDEASIEKTVNDELKDPIEYLQNIYGDKEGIEQAMEIGGINIEEAAEDAVAADGEGHFLSPYDGNIEDLPGGGQFWRTN